MVSDWTFDGLETYSSVFALDVDLELQATAMEAVVIAVTDANDVVSECEVKVVLEGSE